MLRNEFQGQNIPAASIPVGMRMGTRVELPFCNRIGWYGCFVVSFNWLTTFGFCSIMNRLLRKNCSGSTYLVKAYFFERC